MVARADGRRRWEAAKGEPNREAFRKLVEVSAAPRGAGVRRWRGGRLVLDRPACGRPEGGPEQALVREWSADTWSLNCLYGHRGVGVARALVVAAEELAWQRGATEVEAYPQSVARGERQAGAFGWTGAPRFMSRWAVAGRADQDVAAPCFC